MITVSRTVLGLVALLLVSTVSRITFAPTPAVGTGAVRAAQPATLSPSRVEQHDLVSRSLRRTLPYLVYLPPGYDSEPERRYPVLYMLHGLGGDYTEWSRYTLFETVDDLVAAGEIEPFLIVLPQGDGSYWVDHANGGPPWGRYVAYDVVEEIDGRFRTLPERAHRALGGHSMGGHGALQIAMNYPDRFGVVGAHSPTLRRRDTLPPYFGDQAYFDAHDPIHLLLSYPDLARTLELWLDVGEADYWFAIVTAFHQDLERNGIPHAWRTYPGGHEPSYWTAQAAEYVRFYGAALSGDAPY